MSLRAASPAPAALAATGLPRPLVAVIAAIGVACGLATVSTPAALVVAAAPAVVLVSLARWYWLLIPVALEMAIGGWGHAIDIGPLALRHLLVIALLVTWLVNKVGRGDLRLRGGRMAISTVWVVGVTAVAIVLSVLAGNRLAFSEGLTPFFVLLVPVLADLAERDGRAEWILRVFVAGVTALAIAQLALDIAIALMLVNPHALDRGVWRELMVVTVLHPRFARIFIVGSVLYPLVIALLCALALAGDRLFGRRADAAVLFLVTVALFFGFTRGFWLVGGAALAWLWFITTPTGRARWLVASLVGVAGILVVLAIEPRPLVAVFERVTALFSSTDKSVAYRVDLYPRLLAAIAERPLWGIGYGRPLDGLLFFENSYLYYLVKTGFVGLAVMLSGWLITLWRTIDLARRGPTPRSRAIGAGLAAATVAILGITAINPFINSPVGFYFLAVASSVAWALRRQPAVTPSVS